MTTSSPSPSMGRWWSTKRRILAALAVIVVVAAVASVVSFVLRPGEIHFSITHASYKEHKEKGGWVELNLTIVANNTSHRAGVHYIGRAVVLLYTSPAPPTNYSIQAVPTGEQWSRQQPWSRRSMDVSALMSMDDWKSDFPDPTGARSTATAPTLIKVSVVTVVRFKIGHAYTWAYTITALCNPVDYFFNANGSLTSTNINCLDA